MIRSDKEFFNLVLNIANGSIADPHDRRAAELEAAGYLWDSSNWEHLKETAHGKFLRECSNVNTCPCLILRSIYRKQVLESQE